MTKTPTLRDAAQGEELFGDECPGVRGNTRTPKFGERLRGVWASVRNPQRDGMYVKTVRRNSVTCFELTDGKGNFWCYPAKNTVYLDAALAAPADAPPTWPKDAAEVRQFMGANCEVVQFAVDEKTPSDDDRYQLTAHDFLSAVDWWADHPHYPSEEAAQQLQQAVAREREECAVICERAIESIWEYHEENHKRTGRNVCTNLAAAIRAKGQQ